MKIKAVNINRLQIPLKVRFAQSNNATSQSDSTIITLNTTNGILGHGESCPRPYVTGEDFASVKRDLVSIDSLLKSKTFRNIKDIVQFICQDIIW